MLTKTGSQVYSSASPNTTWVMQGGCETTETFLCSAITLFKCSGLSPRKVVKNGVPPQGFPITPLYHIQG